MEDILGINSLNLNSKYTEDPATNVVGFSFLLIFA